MLGPLPLVHQVAVGMAAVLTCAALGLWLGWLVPLSIVPATLALLGAAVGAVAAYVLLHDSTRRPASRP